MRRLSDFGFQGRRAWEATNASYCDTALAIGKVNWTGVGEQAQLGVHTVPVEFLLKKLVLPIIISKEEAIFPRLCVFLFIRKIFSVKFNSGVAYVEVVQMSQWISIIFTCYAVDHFIYCLVILNDAWW